MVNLNKQHQDEKKLFTSLGKEALLEDIIPVLDNFNAAFGAET
jgi:molecular chaperone GrpE (heat shock protein)